MNNVGIPQSGEVTIAALRASGRATITRKEAASVLDVDPRTVSTMIDVGQIFAIRTKGTIRIPLEPFLRLFDPTNAAVRQERNPEGVRELTAVS